MGAEIAQAVIVVGGKGTRLGALTAEIPKPLLPIEGDRRFLDYLLRRIVDRGFGDIILIAATMEIRSQRAMMASP